MKIEKWIVREHHEGVPEVDRMYEKVVEDVAVALAPDEMLFRTRSVSLDLYLHGITLHTPLGASAGADSVMEVVEAGPRARFQVGDLVQGWGGWRSHSIGNGAPDQIWTGRSFLMFPPYRKLERGHYDEVLPLSSALGVLGGSGMTAWGTMTKFLDVRPGNVVLVSGASGCVGSLVGQLAKRAGAARVVATTSSPSKEQYLRGLGFDEVLVYRHGDSFEQVRAALREAAPDGVDRYFDNLGGAITDAAFTMLNIDGKVAVCWQWGHQIASDDVGPRLLPMIMYPRATIRGIYAMEWFTADNWAALREELGGLIRSGEIRNDQTVFHGIDAIPEAYRSLYRNDSGNRGKVLVEL